MPSYSLKVTPANHFVNWQQDPHGNWLARFVFPEQADEFKIEVDLTAELAVINPFDFFVEPYAEEFPFVYAPELATELAAYLAPEPARPLLKQYLEQIATKRDRTIAFLVALNAELQRMIHYVIRMEPGVQEPDETLALGSGSCRDSAWLLVQILRRLGLAARFVSGYLIQLRADVDPIEGPRGTDKDFTDLHAWAEVYIPGAGWIGLDATSGLFCGEGHLPLCATPHYRSAAPITGAGRAGASDVRLRDERDAAARGAARHPALHRRRLEPARRARRSGRSRSRRAGRAPDHGRRADLRLDRRFRRAGMEHRRRRPEQAGARRDLDPPPAGAVRARRPPALRPGQMVSRREPAALGLRALLAQGRQADLAGPVADRRCRRDARRRPTRTRQALAGEVAVRLGIEPDYVIPAYEDAPYWLLRESALPVNVDPSDPKIDDPEERARMVRTFDHGLSRPTGFVLPVQRWNAEAKPAWRSERWPLRRGKLFLVPGDSPVGLRLPMKTLP